MSEQIIGWILLCVMIGASSTYSSFAKELTSALSPLSLLFLSELLTLLFVLTSFGLVPLAEYLRTLPRRRILSLLWVGLLSGTIAPLLWFSGLQSTTAVNANLFGNAEMVFLILLAVFVLGERWTAWHMVAGCTIALGIVIVALRGLQEGITFQPGDILILAGSLSFSIGSITFRKYLHHLPPQLAIFVRSLTAITIFLLLHALRLVLRDSEGIGGSSLFAEVQAFPLSLALPLLGFGFIARFLNVFSFYGAIERIPVATVSLLASLSVIVGTLFAHWYLREPIMGYHIVGGVLIILGTIILETLGVHPTEKHQKNHLEQRQHRA